MAEHEKKIRVDFIDPDLTLEGLEKVRERIEKLAERNLYDLAKEALFGLADEVKTVSGADYARSPSDETCWGYFCAQHGWIWFETEEELVAHKRNCLFTLDEDKMLDGEIRDTGGQDEKPD